MHAKNTLVIGLNVHPHMNVLSKNRNLAIQIFKFVLFSFLDIVYERSSVHNCSVDVPAMVCITLTFVDKAELASSPSIVPSHPSPKQLKKI